MTRKICLNFHLNDYTYIKFISICTIRKQKRWCFGTEIRKKLNDVNNFITSINNIKEMITYCKGKNYKSKNENKKYKMLNTILKSFDIIVIIARTSSFIYHVVSYRN